MSAINSIRRTQFRLAGYFALAIALLSPVDWLTTISRDYAMEHNWPAASGTIYNMREESRWVDPPSSRQHRYAVYWAEFDVVLDLPRGQCPGSAMLVSPQPEKCQAMVRSPESKSRATATRWFIRHPLNSMLTVHYDVQSGRLWIGGESILDVYPWDKIGLTAVLLAIAAAMFFIACKISLAEAPDSPKPEATPTMFSAEI
jgi:hypothetical protein